MLIRNNIQHKYAIDISEKRNSGHSSHLYLQFINHVKYGDNLGVDRQPWLLWAL